ncbi:acyl carrier protein [Streptomyces caatingaensis]|uniref:Acyl carrier protein n=1 Tax=Streptomyces caatingaensis TaxID=1678637 RepID=A0A0K9XA24_9ACTN|nr:phosphopantetheine-binding protein [Streptomyces caatingaensis]KNB50249.1 acyl carrier protein [Streptomyces caatingaensis]
MSTTPVPAIDDLRTRVRAVLAARLGDAFEAVPSDADLQQALGERYDSLTAMECISAVEEEFGIEVDFVADDVRHWFSTVDLMASFTHDRLEDSAALMEGR